MSKASKILDQTSESLDKSVKLKVRVPSFTFSGDFRIRESSEEEKGRLLIKQLVNIEMETFQNDVEKVLDVVITKALVDTVNKAKLTIKPVTEKGSYVGGHGCTFPNTVNVNYK